LTSKTKTPLEAAGARLNHYFKGKKQRRNISKPFLISMFSSLNQTSTESLDLPFVSGMRSFIKIGKKFLILNVKICWLCFK
jgi:hypothetical protein